MEMRTRNATAWIFALTCLLAAAPGQAEESSEPERSFGLGMDLGVHATTHLRPMGLGGLGGLGPRQIDYVRRPAVSNSLRIPVRLADNWYLEPKVSGTYSRRRDTYLPPQNMSDDNGEAPGEQTISSQYLSLDLTLQFRRTWEVGEATRAFAGAEVESGLWRRSESAVSGSRAEQRVDPDTRGMHFAVGPVLGAEHFIWRSLSLGLEARLLGRFRRSETDTISEPSTDVSISPGASLVVRTYF